MKNRVSDLNGNPIGKRNDNPILDTRMYDLQFPDGSVEQYTANIVAESMYSSIDDDGRMFSLLDAIIDHEKDGSAVRKQDATITNKYGRQVPRPTTKGWRLLVSWKDGTESWCKLSDLKESFPVETAQYAVSSKISDQPAFRWWVHHVLRRKNRILKATKRNKYWDRTHKFGIELPHSIPEALAIDRKNGTDDWEKAIAKEMRNNEMAFEFDPSYNVEGLRSEGFSKITTHMIFDVKLGSLTRKARLVADGHKVQATAKEHTFSSVPSRDSVRIFFLLAALNNLDVLSADIQNAYLTAPIKKKYYLVARAEDGFPPHLVGQACKIVRALYGLPVAGASFRSYLTKHLRSLGYKPCKADPDVHMRIETRKDGSRYWAYLIAYVDDIICCSENPRKQLETIEQRFTLKDGTIEVPKLYLGADIHSFEIHGDSIPKWAMSSEKYAKKAVDAVEKELGTEQYGYKYLPNKVSTPLTSDYRPEVDVTAELNPSKQNYYQGLIGVLRWLCELGRLDLVMPVFPSCPDIWHRQGQGI